MLNTEEKEELIKEINSLCNLLKGASEIIKNIKNEEDLKFHYKHLHSIINNDLSVNIIKRLCKKGYG